MLFIVLEHCETLFIVLDHCEMLFIVLEHYDMLFIVLERCEMLYIYFSSCYHQYTFSLNSSSVLYPVLSQPIETLPPNSMVSDPVRIPLA